MLILQFFIKINLTKNCEIQNIVKSYVVFKCKYNILTHTFLLYIYILY